MLLVPLFEQFIKETKNGKRRKLNGELIKPQTVKNYHYCLKQVMAFEAFKGKPLSIKINIRNSRRAIIAEHNYWKRFYYEFSDFLYHQGYYDNFVGSVFKTLKCLFRYLKNEKCYLIQEAHKTFYVRREDIRIISLLPEQFCFLAADKDFHENLPVHQRKYKDLFVFGCMAALRFSDLMSLRVKDVECKAGNHFLVFHSVKTTTPVSVKLPGFALAIFNKYAKYKKPGQYLFPRVSKVNFNKGIRKIGERAGWTERIGKYRTKNGSVREIRTRFNSLYRFCDQLSSHTMRRTGITLLLMLGMHEYLVRKISGHSANSKEFYRYVHVAQSHITEEIDRVHEKLSALLS